MLIAIVIYLLVNVVGYLLGSLSTSIIIGKVFFNVDVRDHGSGNAGGTNAGRVLGGKAGAIVIIIDILKMAIYHWILVVLFRFTSLQDYVVADYAVYSGCLFLALGHCFPIFYDFKGGKAVSVLAGFLLATNWAVLLITFISFGITLLAKKMVSLSSIVGTITAIITSWLTLIPGTGITFYPLVYSSFWYPLAVTIIGVILIILHSSNIKRIINKTERKITWI